MHLKALEVNGFKSFAEKVRIDFTKGITSVVGPNGSGKSNILDSILWVLGEQSYKNIRAKASTDVIFSGGKNRKAKSFAEVTLIVDNTDGTLAMDSEEIRITRHITDKSENTYLINDEKCRLKDIQELFMDTGVGKSAYSVIGQGKVERIISSSTKEIRSIIEEAAGIKKIKLRKEEANKKLEKVNIEIDKIAYVEKELGNNLKNITKQAEKAMKYKEYEAEKNTLKKSILTEELRIKSDNFGDVKRREQKLKETLELLQDKFSASEDRLEEVIESRKRTNQAFEDKEEENRSYKEELELVGNERVRLTERLSSIKKEIWEKNESIVALEKKEEKKKDELAELKAKEDELNKYIENEEHTHEEDNLYLTDLEDGYYELEETIRKSKERVLDFEVDRVKYLNNIEEANKREKNQQKRLEDLKTEKDGFQKKHDEAEKAYREIKAKKEELKVEADKLREERKKLLENKKAIEEKLKKASKERDEAEHKWRNKNNRFETLKKIDESNEGYFKGVKVIMNEKIGGVKGPILSLIEIPEKFLRAIESSAGNSLQDIVVENSNVAKTCIKVLKEKNGGRASFLPLDRIKHSSLSYTFREDKVYGTANELVKHDFSIKKAIDFVLSKILVVEDMDTALLVQQKGTFRGTIVTLEGDIVSTTGRITGGEKLKSASSIIFERKRELQVIEEELGKLKGIYDFGQNIYNKLDTEYKGVIEKLEKSDYIQEEVRVKVEETDKTYNESALAMTQTEKNLQIVDYEIREIKEGLEEYRNKKDYAQQEIDKIQAQLDELKEKNQALEKKRQEEKEILEEAKKEKSGKQMAYIARVEERKQVIRSISGVETTLLEIKEEIEEAAEYINKAKEEQVLVESKQEGTEEEIKEKKAIYETRLEEVNKIRAEILKLEEEEKTLIIEIKNVERDIVKEEGKVVNVTEKRDKLAYQIEGINEKLDELAEVAEVELVEDLKEAKVKLQNIEVKIKALGYVNLLAVEEYEQAKEKHDFISEQKSDLVTSKKNLENLIEEIEHTIKNSFYDAYREIDQNFAYMCREILNNSIGKLKMLDESNLLESGVELMVKYKNKKTQSLSLLSGGEKSMVAVALIMAIFMYKPSPFTFFDEIEAALDESNTKRLIRKLKEFTDKSQFILITHNKHTMKESDTLYGVTMNKEIGESKILSVKL